MASPTRLIVRGAPLPTSFKGTLNQFYKAMLDRLEILSPFGQLQFQVGGVKPTSNVGPWLKDGTEWWVWDESLKDYIPITVNPLSFAGILVDYYTKTETNALFSPYSTTTAMNAAIAAAISGATPSSYPAQGVVSGQVLAITGSAIKLGFNTATINPAPAPFNAGTNRYVAPATGIYNVSVCTQFDNSTGVAASMEVSIALHKNGSFIGNGMGDIDSTPSPSGSRWSPSFSGLVALNAGDYVEIFAIANDGVNTGDLTVTVANMSVCRVSG